MRSLHWLALLAAGAALLTGGPFPALAQKKGPEFQLPASVEVLKDVPFGKGGGRDLTMHILRPMERPRAATPVLLWVHGGGWQKGSWGVGRVGG